MMMNAAEKSRIPIMTQSQHPLSAYTCGASVGSATQNFRLAMTRVRRRRAEAHVRGDGIHYDGEPRLVARSALMYGEHSHVAQMITGRSAGDTPRSEYSKVDFEQGSKVDGMLST